MVSQQILQAVEGVWDVSQGAIAGRPTQFSYVCTACSSPPTLKVEKASEATSKLLTSTLSKYSLNKGPSSTILQQGIHV